MRRTIVGQKELQTGERGLSYILIALGLFAVYAAAKISGSKLTISSPGAFPLFISSLLLIFGIWIWGEKRKFSPDQYSGYGEKMKALGELIFTKDVVVIISLLFLYSIGMNFLGFPIATLAFLWVGISYLKRGNLLRNLLISLLNLGVILFIFKLIFKVILP